MRKQPIGRKRKHDQPKIMEEQMLASVASSASSHSMAKPLNEEVIAYYHQVKALVVVRKDPMTFWGDDQNFIKFPILRRIALQVLPCQPTFGDVERTASKGSLIVTKHRNGKTVSDLVSAASLCATKEHTTTTRKKKASEHFDTFVSSMITFAKSDGNSKFNEYSTLKKIMMILQFHTQGLMTAIPKKQFEIHVSYFIFHTFCFIFHAFLRLEVASYFIFAPKKMKLLFSYFIFFLFFGMIVFSYSYPCVQSSQG